MRSCRPPLFRRRQFEPIMIVTCVQWYCRFSLSLRELEELMSERGVAVDHTTIWRWVQRYGPEVQRRLRGQLKLKSSTWHMDETFVRIAGRWLYLFRAVNSHGQTVDFYLSETRDREAAKCFLERALENPDNSAPYVFARDGLRRVPLRSLITEPEGDSRLELRMTLGYAAMPNSSAMKCACPTVSPLASHLTLPFRIMATASIPCNVRQALWNEP